MDLLARAGETGMESVMKAMSAIDTVSHKPVLLAWWGALARGGETIGDLYALENVARQLTRAGRSVVVATDTAYQALDGFAQVNWRECNAADYSALAFVCGPVIGDSPEFRGLVSKFDGIHKVGIGVSVLPATSPSHWQPFDAMFARDGDDRGGAQFGDLCGFALQPPKAPVNPSVKAPRIGMCLRGAQREYGEAVSLHAQANDMLSQVASRLEGSVVELDTRLHKRVDAANDILAAFSACDVILTTRMHGALLALACGVPFLAIDQVAGGAKVSAVVGQTGWPLVHRADRLPAQSVVAQVANELVDASVQEALRDAQERFKRLGEVAAEVVVAHFVGAVPVADGMASVA